MRIQGWTPSAPMNVLRFAAAAIRHAHATAPNRWGLTTYPDGCFNFNVGWSQIMTAYENKVDLLVTLDLVPGVSASKPRVVFRESDPSEPLDLYRVVMAGTQLSFCQKHGQPHYYQRSPGSAYVEIPLRDGLPVGRILTALQPALLQNVTVSARFGLGKGVREGHQDSGVRAIAARLGEILPFPNHRSSKTARRARAGSPEYWEGTLQRATLERLERSRGARRVCIARHRCTCLACGFNFEATYGQPGTGFIIVHHLNPLAASRGRQPVDPYKDLRPVCANCHYMIHTEDPPLTIEEVRRLLAAAKANKRRKKS
jgi:hypothetical protein